MNFYIFAFGVGIDTWAKKFILFSAIYNFYCKLSVETPTEDQNVGQNVNV